MRNLLRATVMVVALGYSGPVMAGVWEDITAAYTRDDYATALRLLRPLAEQGNAAAQFNLGHMYANGRGVPNDDVQAVKWFRLAAEQGYADAQVILGLMYAYGRGVPKDDVQAVKWYRLAAEKGYAQAQAILGFMYANGRGVPKDYVLAYMWANLGAAGGHEDAREIREEYAAKMTPTQIAEAQKLSREWKPTPAQ